MSQIKDENAKSFKGDMFAKAVNFRKLARRHICE